MASVLSAVHSMDGPRIHTTLMHAVVSLRSTEFRRELVLPLLSRVGELWATEAICPAQEHVLSVNLRRVLAWMMDSMWTLGSLPIEHDAPVLVCTTPSSQTHELGAMLAGITAAEERWRVAYLGPDLPAEDIAVAAKLTGANVVALSVVYGRDGDTIRKEIEKLRGLLPAGVMLVVGGEGTRNAGLETTGAIVLPNFEEFLVLLRTRDDRTAM